MNVLHSHSLPDVKLGAHVSAAGGVNKAIERAAAIGANCVQVFSGSPRVWQRPNLDAIDADKVSTKQKELLVSPIITHALYLVNLASENPELQQKSVNAISFDLQFDAKLGGSGVVVHVGSHQGRGWEAVCEQVVTLIAKIIAASPPESHFLIENAAGQNGKIGGNLAEIKWMIDQVKSDQLGWCFDTCHGFAGGYDLATVGERFAEFDLWKTLRCIHVNDSRDPFDSGRDRHANLGDGNIPAAELQTFLRLPEVQKLPMILEVPGIKDEGPDAENVRRLKVLAGAN